MAEAGRKIRALRHVLVAEHKISLRNLYRSLELPGAHPLKDAQEELESAVCAAYGMKVKAAESWTATSRRTSR